MNPLASQIKEKKIGDFAYRVEPLGFTEGRKAFVRLSNLLGGAMRQLAGIAKTEGNAAAMAVGASAVGSLLESISDSDLEYFQGIFSPKTTVILPDGKQPTLKHIINDHFAGRYADYFQWLIFSIEVSFGDFFRDAWRMAEESEFLKVAAKPSS